jgi:hypothetical protein
MEREEHMFNERRKLAALVTALALIVSPLSIVPARAEQAAEGFVIAKTPQEHLAAAKDFREKAKAERERAQFHHEMAKAYLGSKAIYYVRMKEHCGRIIALDEKLADEYDALAAAEEAAAKR